MKNDAEVLVVDDSHANLEVITEILSSVGYRVSIAISGDRALKRLQNYVPDLILLDVQMPGIDGFQTCNEIKHNPKTANIPIIFLTALSDTDNVVRGFSLGAVDYISKPFKELELLTRVKTHLQLRLLTQCLEERVAERTEELQATLEQLQQSRLQLVQTEKMSALGNLVAGVAHEINNPLGFLSGSIINTKDYVQDLLDYVDLYQHHHPNAAASVQAKAKDIDLEFISEDLPKLLNSMKGAIDRIKGISTSLRTFSRADMEHKVSTNLHDGIDSTLLILKYRLKANEHRPEIQVIQDYGEIPLVECFPGQLNQVFMNILANAIDMFDEIAQTQPFDELESHPQQITLRTTTHENQVEIQICDNGKGMTEEVRAKIFDHLFTTKGVGKGTGLGLAIARQIVVEKHDGTIEVNSQVGKGTEFTICLPMET